MQLLFSSPVPQQQFASLSLLLPPGSMAEPLLTVAPTLVLSQDAVLQALTDLHGFIYQQQQEGGDQDETSTTTKNKWSHSSSIQTFRYGKMNNVALHYRVVRGAESLRLQTLVTQTKSEPSAAGVIGVVLVVGVMGHESLYGSSQAVYEVPQRMQDCLGYLMAQTLTRAAALALLYSFLLSPRNPPTVHDTLTFPAPLVRQGVLSPMMMPGRGRHHNQNNTPTTVEWNVAWVETPSAEKTRALMDRLTILSVAEESAQLAKYERTLPERKAALDLGGRFRRRQGDADLDQMEYKGGVVTNSSSSTPTKTTTLPQPRKNAAADKLRSSKKDTKISLRPPGGDTAAFDPFRKAKRRGSVGEKTLRQLQVNFALNEDLTCSYKMSQLAVCSVEGVVQVQIKSSNSSHTARSEIHFDLLLRDANSQLDSLTENQKFVTPDGPDHRFHIAIPQMDTYFPLLKYKCSGELRPVPIRVQTKVKTDGDHARIALQISSNPNNTTPLSDLTIMLGAPNTILGETLTSQPSGGVWEPSKSSVLWCVSELGSGEKFQLQARFVIREGSIVDESQFPVLVRCQSLQAQLSEVALEARSQHDTLHTKIARRYRVSHREKNG